MITPSYISAIAPKCDAGTMARALDAAAHEFGISTPKQVAHWLAQLIVESAGLTHLEENLSYSPARLVCVWPSRFPSEAAAAPYARNPRALAEKVYGGRMGNNEIGDGWRYRGRGLIMTTGRAMYALTAAGIGIDLLSDPDQLSHPTVAARAAGWFWEHKELNDMADMDDIVDITRVINGGLTGLADRRLAYASTWSHINKAIAA